MTTASVPLFNFPGPSVTISPFFTVGLAATRGGNAVNGRGGLLAGQLAMKVEAMLNTRLKLRGVSNGEGNGFSLLAIRRKVLCRASTGRMDPPAGRIVRLEMNGTAPRYALTPTLHVNICGWVVFTPRSLELVA